MNFNFVSLDLRLDNGEQWPPLSLEWKENIALAASFATKTYIAT